MSVCRAVLDHRLGERDAKVRPLLDLHRWNTIAARMRRLMDQALAGGRLSAEIPPEAGAARRAAEAAA